ncbi:MAG: hypothetical protein JST40_01890 [Armatimonadetes bacterium]|nr:hypothetical protein [Armatimonadota bacterium]
MSSDVVLVPSSKQSLAITPEMVPQAYSWLDAIYPNIPEIEYYYTYFSTIEAQELAVDSFFVDRLPVTIKRFWDTVSPFVNLLPYGSSELDSEYWTDIINTRDPEDFIESFTFTEADLFCMLSGGFLPTWNMLAACLVGSCGLTNILTEQDLPPNLLETLCHTSGELTSSLGPTAHAKGVPDDYLIFGGVEDFLTAPVERSAHFRWFGSWPHNSEIRTSNLRFRCAYRFAD